MRRPKTLLDSIRYKTFVSQRDLALEKIHQYFQVQMSSLLKETLDNIESEVSRILLHGDYKEFFNFNKYEDLLSNKVKSEFYKYFSSVLPVFLKLRRYSFILTYTSELEAISRGTSKKYHVNKNDFYNKLNKATWKKTIDGKTLENRILLSLIHLRYRIVKAFTSALMQELPEKEILEKVKSSFPKIQTYKKPPRELKPFREAERIKDKETLSEFYSFDFIDDADWDLILETYKGLDLPGTRFETWVEGGEYSQYAWELEQDLTDDFVKQVRDSQVEAANDAGIQDFVWVAILDDKTDDCCADRNGHTTEEIEEMLSSGELNADDCDATSPPAHPNCRCQLAPVASTDQVEGPDWKSFNEWLES